MLPWGSSLARGRHNQPCSTSGPSALMDAGRTICTPPLLPVSTAHTPPLPPTGPSGACAVARAAASEGSMRRPIDPLPPPDLHTPRTRPPPPLISHLNAIYMVMEFMDHDLKVRSGWLGRLVVGMLQPVCVRLCWTRAWRMGPALVCTVRCLRREGRLASLRLPWDIFGVWPKPGPRPNAPRSHTDAHTHMHPPPPPLSPSSLPARACVASLAPPPTHAPRT